MNEPTFTYHACITDDDKTVRHANNSETPQFWSCYERMDDGRQMAFADCEDGPSAKAVCDKLNALLAENADLRDKCATLEALQLTAHQ